jgi:hypothetical protein
LTQSIEMKRHRVTFQAAKEFPHTSGGRFDCCYRRVEQLNQSATANTQEVQICDLQKPGFPEVGKIFYAIGSIRRFAELIGPCWRAAG